MSCSSIGNFSASLSPTTLSWGIVAIGTTSQSRTTTLINSDKEDVSIYTLVGFQYAKADISITQQRTLATAKVDIPAAR